MKKEDYIGKYLLVGITFKSESGEFLNRTEQHGKIIKINSEGIYYGDEYDLHSIPPDVSNLIPADPGIYTLHSTGEKIENPDFTSVWTIVKKGIK